MPNAAPCFYFVIDGDRLELQSIFLAATLRRHNPQARLLGYISPATRAALRPFTRTAYAAARLELSDLPTPGRLWARTYPHGNKLLAAAEPREGAVSVFLDTDMVAVGPLTEDALPGPGEVCVVPEGVASWGAKGDRWPRAYAHFGLPMPTEEVRLTRRGRKFVPYFNAGFVAFRDDDRIAGKTFGQHWRDTASEFDHGAKIANKRPWLDQITMPLTMARFGYRYRVIDTMNNLTISKRLMQPDMDPRILHYHRGRYLMAWPHWPDVLDCATAAMSAPERSDFLAALDASGFTASDDSPEPETADED